MWPVEFGDVRLISIGRRQSVGDALRVLGNSSAFWSKQLVATIFPFWRL
ncbi:MAG: hypothetical protein HQK51_17660 [Oligoflexia bacterium]|nr:hypothetical protein [Oligoflexia bacterium]